MGLCRGCSGSVPCGRVEEEGSGRGVPKIGEVYGLETRVAIIKEITSA